MRVNHSPHAYMTMQSAMNVIGMRDGSEKEFGAGYNVLPVWKERMDSRTWVPTPNADVIYSMSYLDLSVLSLARAEQTPLSLEKFAVDTVIRDVINDLQVLITRTGTQLTLPDTVFLETDRQCLYHVLLNLIDTPSNIADRL